jgi:hypothetical protein
MVGDPMPEMVKLLPEPVELAADRGVGLGDGATVPGVTTSPSGRRRAIGAGCPAGNSSE